MNAKPLPVCPKCGYRASSADDPLAKGPFERRECPACGIFLAKYLKLQRGNTVTSGKVLDPNQSSHALPFARPSTTKRAGKVIVVFAVIFLLVYAGVKWNGWSLWPFGNPAGFKEVPWLVGANSAEVLVIGPT